MRILFVCTGNLCRSPLAEGLARAAPALRGVEPTSAGTWAVEGLPATSEAVAVAAALGVDISGHRSRRLRAGDVAAADLVVVMTSVHRAEVVRLAPGHADKVVLLKELAELEPAPAADDGDRLTALLSAPRPAPRRALDLDDPMGLPLSAYERAAGEIAAGIEALGALLGQRA